MAAPNRFNIHWLRRGACIWRLYRHGQLIARSPKGVTFKNGVLAKKHAKLVLFTLKTIDLG